MSDFDVTVTRTIHAGAEQVWRALTQAELVARWMMGATVESTWTAGTPIRWNGEYKGKKFTDKGQVLEVEPLKRLKHTHFSAMSGAEDKPENYHTLNWKLNADGPSTKLTLVQSGAHSKKEAGPIQGKLGEDARRLEGGRGS